MQKFRSQAGFTLIEAMLVMGIIGIVTTIGFTSLRSYNRHEDTRRAATSVANVLTKARSEAVSGGRMTFVVFGEPGDGSIPFDANQIAAVVVDLDGDGKIGAADAVSPVYLPAGINSDISSYGAHGDTEMKNTPLPSADESQTLADGEVSALTNGTSIPVDADLGVPIIAFGPQGSPVTIGNPSNWGAGAGGVYVTDNDGLMLAVLVQPMGEVKTMSFDSSSQKWK